MPSRADLISTDVDRAADRLRLGGLVAIPTETVYGLAADAENPEAVARVFSVKGRPTGHPVIVHIAGLHVIDGWADDITESANALAVACWPGPLTMLLRRGQRVLDVVTGGRPTVGLRAPGHPIAQELIERFGGGVAAPSANRFGRVSPTTAGHVFHDIGELLDPDRDLILDGGPSPIGIESTIVDMTADPPQVLRSGAIGSDDVEAIIEHTVGATSGASRASGMLVSHYAPSCRVILANDIDEAEQTAQQMRSSGKRIGLLDRTDDLTIAARELYSDLRAADEAGMAGLVVVLPPAEGLGIALRDRLTKAAAADRVDSSQVH
jgi:L-threonylcarbamoyladenylate synthase